MQSLCQDADNSSLLQFKQSFVFDKFPCHPSTNYTKLDSWKVGDDCCSWDGVACNDETGHVIGLDLSSRCLYGSINSTSPLFQLHHLRYLDLSFNNFNLSGIPPGIRSLSGLTHLNLTFSNFSGQIPSEMLELSKLVSVDLSLNSLILRKPSLKDVAETLTNLTKLHLSCVNISSHVPQSLSNLTSLSSLLLENCSLQGEFPSGIFRLPDLRLLSLRDNPDLNGYLPEFQVGSALEMLRLQGTNFSGQLPLSIGNLNSLRVFTAWRCRFGGVLPSVITGNLSKLHILDLSHNYFAGQVPSWLGNSTQLTQLLLSNNELQGPIPDSIFQLPYLQVLNLNFNKLSGTLEFDSFLQLKYLSELQLSGNHLSLISSPYMNITLPKFQILGLRGCNLRAFPAFLQGQNEVEYLDLANNSIEGYVPNWIFTMESLSFLDLANNFLIGCEQPLNVHPWSNLQILNLTSNKLEGPLPIPPSSIQTYDVSWNNFHGDVSPLFCNLTSLLVFDLSNNNLSGHLPRCLGKLGDSALVLDLRNNSLSGKIPDTFASGCAVKLMDLSQNRIEGAVPKSLANCSKLEILNLEKNEMNDVFPSWLGILPRLRILSLRSNNFHGAIGQPLSKSEFGKLQIIDLSDNNFTGKLPSEYIQNWVSMKSVNYEQLAYMEANASFHMKSYIWTFRYPYFIRIVSKGIERAYDQILEFFVVVDLSRNRFEGEIPEIIGTLRELQFLNLSNNILTGQIPPSLVNLKKLEALDLSRNKLSGKIPMQLSVLTFLSIFNVSYNNLTGLIPGGNQFETFQNDSLLANPGLCGSPLSRKCENIETLSLPPSEDEDVESTFEFSWEIVLIGFGSGLVIGVAFGCAMNTRKYEQRVKKKFARWLRS
ncbi:receptor-like protein 7 [Euphorbia lathyris]|uniref:receptor-like protein 7 n=1 Tax=Euphorbia lathyris TaxID=212925 RepID=UPI0033136CB1